MMSVIFYLIGFLILLVGVYLFNIWLGIAITLLIFGWLISLGE